MNLLAETKKAIKENGKGIADIRFIGSLKTGHRCTWNRFKKLADQEYDNDFGRQEVASDLSIVFGDRSALHRHEYDGSEWWTYRTASIPDISEPIKTLFANSGQTLNEGQKQCT